MNFRFKSIVIFGVVLAAMFVFGLKQTIAQTQFSYQSGRNQFLSQLSSQSLFQEEVGSLRMLAIISSLSSEETEETIETPLPNSSSDSASALENAVDSLGVLYFTKIDDSVSGVTQVILNENPKTGTKSNLIKNLSVGEYSVGVKPPEGTSVVSTSCGNGSDLSAPIAVYSEQMTTCVAYLSFQKVAQTQRPKKYSCGVKDGLLQCVPDNRGIPEAYCKAICFPQGNCDGNKCTTAGAGAPCNISQDAQTCQNKRHSECIGQTCVKIIGPGKDLCNNSFECRYSSRRMGCKDGKCQLLKEVGANSCTKPLPGSIDMCNYKPTTPTKPTNPSSKF